MRAILPFRVRWAGGLTWTRSRGVSYNDPWDINTYNRMTCIIYTGYVDPRQVWMQVSCAPLSALRRDIRARHGRGRDVDGSRPRTRSRPPEWPGRPPARLRR